MAKIATVIIPYPEKCEECPFHVSWLNMIACQLEQCLVLQRNNLPTWCSLEPDDEPHSVKEIMEEKRKRDEQTDL